MKRTGLIFAAVVVGAATFGVAAMRAEDVSASGRASMTYEGLVSAVTQEREFDLHVHRDDGQVVSAPVQIKGADGFTGGDLGDVDWQISGDKVTGTLTKNGRQIVTFDGTVGETGMSGSFRTPDGHTGSWTAPAPAKQ